MLSQGDAEYRGSSAPILSERHRLWAVGLGEDRGVALAYLTLSEGRAPVLSGSRDSHSSPRRGLTSPRGVAARPFLRSRRRARPATFGRSRPAKVRAVALALFVLGLLALAGVGSAWGAEGEGCPNEAIRLEQGSTYLPQCRAYEMVTPSYKGGYSLGVNSFTTDGGSAILTGLSDLAEAPGEGESAVKAAAYLDRRTDAGWQLSPLNAPLSEYVGQLSLAFEAGDGDSLWEQHRPSESALSRGLYLRTAQGGYEFIGPLNSQPTKSEQDNYIDTGPEHEAQPIAATRDYNHVVLQATRYFWSFDDTKENGDGSLYEYSGTGNEQPVLVGVTGVKESKSLIGECGVLPGGGSQGSEYNMISADGETIFFTVVPGSDCGAAGPATAEVYARIHGAKSSPLAAETVEVSASECGGCGAESGKNFEGASENGEVVFFTSTQKLTSNAVEGAASGDASTGRGCAGTAAGKGGCNLYEYDFAAPGAQCQEHHKCLRLLAEGGEVLGVAGIAENGERVYFVSRAVLSGTGVNAYNQRGPQPSEPNLYVHDATTGKTTFIATLAGGQGSGDEADWWRDIVRPVEVAGEGGKFLLFASSAEGLTADDETTSRQLFEYDAVTGELVRVTQGEGGYADNGLDATGITSIGDSLGNGSDFQSSSYQYNISADGKTIVFETTGRLSPLAISAEAGCKSIYEFHSEGTISQGAVSLISDGRDVHTYGDDEYCGARLERITESGDDVLFTTADQLLSSDTNGGQNDIYDARVDGGFAAISSTSCGGGGCEGSVSAPSSVFGAPGSATSTGSGNLSAPAPVASVPKTKAGKKAHRCPKGKRRGRDGCMKRRTKKAKKMAGRAGANRRARR